VWFIVLKEPSKKSSIQVNMDKMREFSFDVTEREKLHLEAVEAWAKRDIKKACRQWEKVLLNYPNDVLALKLANDVKGLNSINSEYSLIFTWETQRI
jgi:plasmid maintenance system killer protein